MIIDLSCPLELRGYEILHDDGDNVRAYIELLNLMDKRISQFDAVVRWISTEYGEHEEIPFFADQLRASARTTFHISVSNQHFPIANQLEIYFLRICFEDDSPDWIGDPDRLIDIDLNEEIDGRTLNTLMSLAGRDAVRFPRKTKDYWICVCGHVNGVAHMQCRRCRRGMDMVLNALSREAILLDKAPALPEILMPEPIDVHLPFFDPPVDEEIIESGDGERPQEEAPAEDRTKPHFLLLRNIIFLLTLVLLLCGSVFLWIWLDEKSTRAKDVRPPVPTQRSTQKITYEKEADYVPYYH